MKKTALIYILIGLIQLGPSFMLFLNLFAGNIFGIIPKLIFALSIFVLLETITLFIFVKKKISKIYYIFALITITTFILGNIFIFPGQMIIELSTIIVVNLILCIMIYMENRQS